MFDSAIWATGDYRPRDYILASVVTVLVPAFISGLLMWLVPGGCELRKDASDYRWTCLLPGLMIMVPAVVALCLPFAININRRLGRRFPDGWFVTILAVGAVTQLTFIGGFLLLLDPAYRGLLLNEIAFFPQPFVAGTIAGCIYWVALNIRVGGRRPKPCR
jgi:hypothetical protein